MLPAKTTAFDVHHTLDLSSLNQRTARMVCALAFAVPDTLWVRGDVTCDRNKTLRVDFKKFGPGRTYLDLECRSSSNSESQNTSDRHVDPEAERCEIRIAEDHRNFSPKNHKREENEGSVNVVDQTESKDAPVDCRKVPFGEDGVEGNKQRGKHAGDYAVERKT